MSLPLLPVTGIIIPYSNLTVHNSNGIIEFTSGTPTASGTISGAMDISSGTVGRFTSNSGGIYDTHILNKWTYNAHVYNLDSSGIIGFGLYDKIREGVLSPPAPAPPRHIWLTIDRPSGLMYLTIYEGFGPAFSTPISSTFNYADFTVNIQYKGWYIDVVLRDSNGLVITYKFRWDMRGGQQPPAPSNFAFKQRVGTSTIKEIGISSNTPTGVNFLFVGDSITAGRKNYPETVRFASLIKKKFVDTGILNKTFEIWGSGSMAVHTEFPYLKDSIVALAPQNVIILMGDNDDPAIMGDINDLTSYIGRMGEMVAALRAAGTNVYVISMTPEGLITGGGNVGQKHDFQHTYLQSTFNSDLISKYGAGSTATIINVWDTLKSNPNIGPDTSGTVREYGDQQYLVDQVHPNALGHQTIADIIWANIPHT